MTSKAEDTNSSGDNTRTKKINGEIKKVTKLIILGLILFTTTAFAQTYTVEKVIDGDTFKMTNGEMVQLIGIDAPEIIVFEGDDLTLIDVTEEQVEELQRWNMDVVSLSKRGEIAKTQLLDLEGREVRLKFDVQKKDKDGSLLAYVYLLVCENCILEGLGDVTYSYFDDNAYNFLNATIVGKGYAAPMAISPNVKHVELFKKLHEEARGLKRGLWQSL